MKNRWKKKVLEGMIVLRCGRCANMIENGTVWYTLGNQKYRDTDIALIDVLLCNGCYQWELLKEKVGQ